MSKQKRSAGVLCHISAVPGKYGVGSLGKDAYRFAKILSKSRVRYWQILPLAQTGSGNSPYRSVSTTSGNPYFLDLDLLAKDKLITKEELKGAKSREIDYEGLSESRYPLLRTAFSRFNFDSKPFRAYIKSGAAEDYALYMTAKSVFGGTFADWDEPLMRRDAEAIEVLRTEHHEEYLFWYFLQFEFRKQWNAFRRYSKGVGIRLIGDFPLYCMHDSADMWVHPELFRLDEALRPQNGAERPEIDWKAMEAEDFRSLKARLKKALETYDVVRIGCFNELAESCKHAEKLFEGLDCAGRIIADFSGEVGEETRRLLAKTGVLETKVLLSAFDGEEENRNLPKGYAAHSACYTGTHDDATVTGFVSALSTEEYILFRSRVATALEEAGIAANMGADGEGIPEALISLALASGSELAVVPIQDILKLDGDARMNCSGSAEGNWQFRLNHQPSALEMSRLKKMIKKYRR